jgi:hypothetical protein
MRGLRALCGRCRTSLHTISVPQPISLRAYPFAASHVALSPSFTSTAPLIFHFSASPPHTLTLTLLHSEYASHAPSTFLHPRFLTLRSCLETSAARPPHLVTSTLKLFSPSNRPYRHNDFHQEKTRIRKRQQAPRRASSPTSIAQDTRQHGHTASAQLWSPVVHTKGKGSHAPASPTPKSSNPTVEP